MNDSRSSNSEDEESLLGHQHGDGENRGRQTTQTPLRPTSIGQRQEDGEEDEVINEKQYRYFRDLPVPEQLTNANRKQPGVASIIGGIALLIGVGYLIAQLASLSTRFAHVKKVNVILMISDGYGPASETFARSYLQYLAESNHPSVQQPDGRWAHLIPVEEGKRGKKQAITDYRLTLPLDSILIGSSRTRSSSSLITDSAAGATAFSCALKSYNGAIGVEPSKRNPCGTVLEAAKHQGYKTGLVVTSRITHATPASFYAHVPDRDMESKIAEQLLLSHPLGNQVDLAFGGGLCFFLPNTSYESCRTDGLDVFGQAEAGKGSNPNHPFKLVTTRAEFDQMSEEADSIGTLGLFNRDHMEYEVDRLAMSGVEQEREPSLRVMADKAIRILKNAVKKDSAHGFFLMIEGSRIDMAAHSNDPVGHVQEILSYQSTVQLVKGHVDALNEAGTPTILISTSDHETGGLSLGYQLADEVYPTYAWYPDALVNGTRTSVAVARKIFDNTATITIEQLKAWLRDDLGVMDADDSEIQSVLALKDDSTLWFLDHALSKLTSRRAQIGWSTEGHSGVDVNLYGYPFLLTAPYLGGVRENTEIGVFIADTMQLNLQQITTSLQNNIKAWYNPASPKLDAPNATQSDTIGVLHYHGEHRH